MATIKSYKKAVSGEKYNRYFSEELKKKIVDEIDRKLSTITEVSREYGVSATSVYKWLYRYSRLRKRGIRQVMEIESDTRKLKGLKDEIKELQRIIGEKQVIIDFQKKLIQRAEEEYKVDIKKKLSEKLYSGTGSKEKRTDIE